MRVTFRKPEVHFWGPCPTEPDAALRRIEHAGRTCYKSERRITDDSAIKFCRKLFKSGHLSVLEHSNLALRVDPVTAYGLRCSSALRFFKEYPDPPGSIIVGSFRAWIELSRSAWRNTENFSCPHTKILPANDWPEIVWALHEYLPSLFELSEQIREPSGAYSAEVVKDLPMRMRRYTFKIITDRGVTHELVRHRPFVAFSQESTRYVRYDAPEFIVPPWLDEQSAEALEFKDACRQAAASYAVLLRRGWSPQQARAVLPNALKTEIVVTADLNEWEHIIRLRTSAAAHPQIREVIEHVDTHLRSANG